MRNSHENVKNILRALDEAHLTGCAVCLETMGKKSVLGTAEEVCELVAADDRLLPCIDFGHLNCRTGGHMNTREEVKALFDLMENTIGHERTAKLHAHFSHIEYNVRASAAFDVRGYGIRSGFHAGRGGNRCARLRTDIHLRIRRNAGGGRTRHEAVLYGSGRKVKK